VTNPQFPDAARRNNAVGQAFSPAFFLVYAIGHRNGAGRCEAFLS
jgi:hypothetical protein